MQIAEIPQTAHQHLEEIGGADLVVAALAQTPAELEALTDAVRRGLAMFAQPLRTVLIYPGGGEPPAPAGTDDIRRLPLASLPGEPAALSEESISNAFAAVFAICERLRARAVVAIAAGLDSVGPEWIYHLAGPVLDLEFQLVTPCFAHARFEGLINTAIVAPFHRALYGRRIEHPLGPAFGVSGNLARRLLELAVRHSSSHHRLSLAAITIEAIAGDFDICQAGIGPRRYRAADWSNQSHVLVQIAGPVFRQAQKYAPLWQRVRGSQSVPAYGDRGVAPPSDGGAVDRQALIQSFTLAQRNLTEVWGAILPPASLLELTHMARTAPAQFRMADTLWARIVYDFALAHVLRTIDPEHVLRAMTPLYLAWVASYALETEGLGETAIQERRERTAAAFETAKPYALSRWRWPDRFNP
jgi:glucosylglycerate synthase